MENKKLLTDEILSLREELKEKNDMINSLGSNVSFVQVFVIPLLIAALTTFIVSRFSFTNNQSVGFFIVAFKMHLFHIKNEEKSKKNTSR